MASRNTRWGSPEEIANLIVFALVGIVAAELQGLLRSAAG